MLSYIILCIILFRLRNSYNYLCTMAKNVLSVDWKIFTGAAVKRRILRLTSNAAGMFLCPVENCLHIGFKSQRGLHKHIDTRHAWYYYFDVQPHSNMKM